MQKLDLEGAVTATYFISVLCGPPASCHLLKKSKDGEKQGVQFPSKGGEGGIGFFGTI